MTVLRLGKARKPRKPRKPERKSEREKYLLDGEWQALLRAARSLGPVHYGIVLAGGTLGCRIGETVLLRWSFFGDLSRNVVTVHRLKRRVKSPVCEVALSDEHAKLWREYLDSVRRPVDGMDAHLFPGRVAETVTAPTFDDGGHVCKRHASRLFKEALAKAGLPQKYSSHCLRHTAGVRFWSQSKDVVFVKEQLGHSSLRHTERYVHMDIESRVKIARGGK